MLGSGRGILPSRRGEKCPAGETRTVRFHSARRGRKMRSPAVSRYEKGVKKIDALFVRRVSACKHRAVVENEEDQEGEGGDPCGISDEKSARFQRNSLERTEEERRGAVNFMAGRIFKR